MSISAVRVIEEARTKISSLFKIDDLSRIIFTKNSTEALNLAIMGYLSQGDHVITSAMEHNSVMRPLRHLETKGLDLKICKCDDKGFLNPTFLDDLLKNKQAKLVCICHASNVTGTIQNIYKISEICKKYDAKLLLDASQSAGILDINTEKWVWIF